ncbi:hypothetical protein A3A64_03835 [Candidatus Gottesmanbacteria bacterium RIFCSPLOWO2_01_FULL_48_11]|uniref:Antitoxin n=3 Tax=Candidatus Gottesmaniibacteriota TaxID=1752720 RepID=A0A0G1U167_9BACT|nr:MAG: hypothetical protein UY16_C0017G0005 [Candidatus Gottesmanbacteria bacterium GW2011_GWA2_47_9]OGG28384.1 MAG: hypothetical protein A3A64_03835 [Candidatus Gottesmanbacteria bacterium RIFCSPLOWO2_01_FULL_48_11]
MPQLMFPTTISAREIQRGYKKVFDAVKRTKKPVVVMANNNPQAAIISMEMLKKYTELEEEQKFWDTVDQIQASNADKDPDKVFADVTADVEEVRQKLYEETLGRR